METKKNIILVPFDFTELAEVAVAHAAGLAKAQGWSVMLLHIINKDTRALLNVYKVTDDLVNERLNEKISALSAQHNIKFEFIAREGSIFTDIAKVAEECKASFIVMGTHGKQGIQHIVGSYAHKVITSSQIPFIITQNRGYRDGYKNIVLPLDDTLESRQKVKWAIYISKKFNCTVHIKALYKSDELYRAKIKIILKKVSSIFEQNGIDYKTEYKDESGSFAKQVIEYSNKVDADMILIMTNQDFSPVPNFIMNPWDEQILFNDYDIPVMAVNPRDINITVVGL